MSKKRNVLMRWPLEVYDYEKKAITDAAVGGIDLRKGCWIHCKWCNSTLKTTPYSLTSWRTHQRGRGHSTNEQKVVSSLSQPQFISCSSQSSVHGSTSSLPETQQTLQAIKSSQDHESLMLVRRVLHQNKQHQARYERDVTNVINAMTGLVTDQQSDLSTLQLQVHDMACKIEGLKKQVEILRRKESQQKNVRARPKEIVVATSYTSRSNPASHLHSVKTQIGRRLTTSQKAVSTKKTIKRNSMTDMDIFEKRFRLT